MPLALLFPLLGFGKAGIAVRIVEIREGAFLGSYVLDSGRSRAPATGFSKLPGESPIVRTRGVPAGELLASSCDASARIVEGELPVDQLQAPDVLHAFQAGRSVFID